MSFGRGGITIFATVSFKEELVLNLVFVVAAVVVFSFDVDRILGGNNKMSSRFVVFVSSLPSSLPLRLLFLDDEPSISNSLEMIMA